MSAAAEEESSQRKLRATLETTGNEVEGNVTSINAMADSLRDTANVDDNLTRKLASFGLNLGVTTGQINDMTQAAIGLAEATDDDAATSMEKLVKANQGSFMALQKQLPLLAQMRTNEEKLAYVQKIAAQGLVQRRAQLNTAAGATTQLKLATGELAETVGGALSPAITKAAQEMTVLVNLLRQGSGSAGRIAHFPQNDALRGAVAAGNAGNLATISAIVANRQAAATANYNSQRSGNMTNSPMAAMAAVFARTQQNKVTPIKEVPEEELARRLERRDQTYGTYRQPIGNSPERQAVMDKNEQRIQELRDQIRAEGTPEQGKKRRGEMLLNDKLQAAVKLERPGFGQKEADAMFEKRQNPEAEKANQWLEKILAAISKLPQKTIATFAP